MRIEAYFQRVHSIIDSSLIIQTSTVAYDKRATHEGFIYGELYFVDGSILTLREFVDVETTVDRLMYVYHYMDAHNNLIFRYDNTGHHRKLNLPTYPHHKHVDQQDNVIASSAPDLAAVLEEIEEMIHLP